MNYNVILLLLLIHITVHNTPYTNIFGQTNHVVQKDSVDQSVSANYSVFDSNTINIDTSKIPGESLQDTSYRVWNEPFWSIGFAWTLGSMPIYNNWGSGLPSSVKEIPEIADTLDSLNLSFEKNNDPGSYIVNFPISIAYTPFTNDDTYLTVKVIASWINKRFEAVAKDSDSGNVFWSTERNLTFSTLSMSLFYNQLILKKLFFIEKVEKAFFSFGISGYPLVYLKHRIETKNLPVSDTKAYGIGISFYAGISTLRKFADVNGIEAGVLYKGSWFGRFMHEGHHLVNSDINPYGSDNSEVVQFFSHRFLLYFDLLMGKKVKRKQ